MDFADYGDIHVPAAILKKFLRELQEPLMTFDLFEPITRLHCKWQTNSERNASVSRPTCNMLRSLHVFNTLAAAVAGEGWRDPF